MKKILSMFLMILLIIPACTVKIRVGWNNAYVTSLVYGKLSIKNALQTMNL